jgi:hypothetical protein
MFIIASIFWKNVYTLRTPINLKFFQLKIVKCKLFCKMSEEKILINIYFRLKVGWSA